jgi:hypothetical protein
LRSQSAAADLAAAKNESLVEAEQQLAAAYDGRTIAFKRLGIITAEEQKAGIPYEELLKRIEDRMGGTAAAALETYTGKQKELANQIDAQKDAIGTALLPAMSAWQDMLQMISLKAEPLTEQFAKWITDQMPKLSEGFAAFGRVLGDAADVALPAFISMMEQGLKKFAELGTWFGEHEEQIHDFFYLTLAAGAVGALNAMIPLIGGVTGGLEAMRVAIFGISYALDAVAVDAAVFSVVAVSATAASVGVALLVAASIEGVADLIKNWDSYKDQAQRFIDGLKSGFSDMGNGIKNVFLDIGITVNNALADWENALASFLDHIPKIGSGLAAAARSDALKRQGEAIDKQSSQAQSAGFSSAVTQWDKYTIPAAKAEGIDPNLVRAIMQTESGGNPNAISSVGAQGLMQIMPANDASLGIKNPLDPADSIKGGVQYLATQLRAFPSSQDAAIASYNAGPGAVSRYGGVPPFKETQDYVAKVDALLGKTNSSAGAFDPTVRGVDKSGGWGSEPWVAKTAKYGGGDTGSFGSYTGPPDTTKSPHRMPGSATGKGSAGSGSSFTDPEDYTEKTDQLAASQKELDEALKHVNDSEKGLAEGVKLATTAQGQQAAQAALDAQITIDLATKHRMLIDAIAIETSEQMTLGVQHKNAVQEAVAATAAYKQYGEAHNDGSKITADETNKLAALKVNMENAKATAKEFKDQLTEVSTNLAKNNDALTTVNNSMTAFASKAQEATAAASRAWEAYKTKSEQTMADDLATSTLTQSQKAAFYADALTKMQALDAEYQAKYATAQAMLTEAVKSGNADRIRAAMATYEAIGAIVAQTEKLEETTDGKRVAAFVQSMNAMNSARQSWADFQSAQITKTTNDNATRGMSDTQLYHYYAGLYQDDYALWQYYQQNKNVDLATKLLPKMESDVSASNEALKKLYDADVANAKAAHDTEAKDVASFLDDIVIAHKSFSDELKSIWDGILKNYLDTLGKQISGGAGFQSIFHPGGANAGTPFGNILGGAGAAPDGTPGKPLHVVLANGTASGVLSQFTGSSSGISSSSLTAAYNSAASSGLAANVLGGNSAPLGGSVDLGANLMGGNSAPLGGSVVGSGNSSQFSMSGAMGGIAMGSLAESLLGGLFKGQNDSSVGGAVGGGLGGLFKGLGSLGGPIGAVLGTVLGGLFGSHDVQANMPDKYNTATYGAFLANAQGQQVTANGQQFNSADLSKTGGIGDIAYISKQIKAGNLAGLTQQEITEFTNATGIVGGKNGNLQLSNGQTVNWQQLSTDMSDAMSKIGKTASNIPTFAISRDYSPNLSTLASTGNANAAGTPLSTAGVVVNVQGNVIGQAGIQQLATIVSQTIFAQQKGTLPGTGRSTQLTRSGGGY